MARYLEIRAVQSPFPIGVDENERVQYSFNVEAVGADPVNRWEEDLAKILTDASLLTALGTDIFVGPAAVLPKTGNGPFLTILDSGGSEPSETHNGSIYARLSAQLIVRASSFAAARAKALAIWRELDGQRNVTVAS